MKKHPDRLTLQREVSSLTNDSVTLMPIGNHHLMRHQVYKVLSNHHPDRILKYHYLPKTFSRESQALSLLTHKNLPVPELFWSHRYEDGRGLILMSHVPGVSFSSMLKLKDKSRNPVIFKQIGEFLGKLHTINDICCAIDSPWDHLCLSTQEKVTPASVQMDRLNYLLNKSTYTDEITQYAIAYEKKILLKAIDEQQKHPDDTLWPLCHLDLDSRNCLVQKSDGSYNLSGIIDFEHSQRFEPSADWASLWRNHFREDKELFSYAMEGYLIHHPQHKFGADFFEGIERQLLLQCISGLTWSKDIAPSYYQQCYDILNTGFANRHNDKGFL